MPDLFYEESQKFLEKLKAYEKNEINIKEVVNQCKRMNLLFFKDHVSVQKMRKEVYDFLKSFGENLIEIEDILEVKNQDDNVTDQKIEINSEFIQKAAYIGLSQNIPANRAGGLPAFPQKGMLNDQIEDEIEETKEEVFEF